MKLDTTMELDSHYEKIELLEVLKYLVENDYLDDHKAALGISKKIIGEQSFDNLSSDQKNVYKNIILPYLEPRCDGVIRDDDTDTCVSNGVVDTSSLLESYMSNEMLCQHCRYIRNKNNE